MIFADTVHDYYQPEQEEYQQPQPVQPQPVAATLPIAQEKRSWIPDIDFGSINWEQGLRWAIVLCGMGVLVTVTALRPQAPKAGLLNTPASAQVKEMEMKQAVSVVLGKPVQIGTEAVLISDPRQKREAAERVLKWQEGELIQKYANQLNLQILQGIAQSAHPCYQKSVTECVGLLRKQNDDNRQIATANQDYMQLISTAMQDKALDRVVIGDMSAAEYEPELDLVARARYRAAISEIEAASPNGLADKLLERVGGK